MKLCSMPGVGNSFSQGATWEILVVAEGRTNTLLSSAQYILYLSINGTLQSYNENNEHTIYTIIKNFFQCFKNWNHHNFEQKI